MALLHDITDRSLMAKKSDGIKESTDSNTTVEEEETRGWCWSFILIHQRLNTVIERESVSWALTPLTPSMPAVPNCCCLKGLVPYWSNPLFLIFDIREPTFTVIGDLSSLTPVVSCLFDIESHSNCHRCNTIPYFLFNPFSASCSKLLLFEVFSAI